LKAAFEKTTKVCFLSSNSLAPDQDYTHAFDVKWEAISATDRRKELYYTQTLLKIVI